MGTTRIVAVVLIALGVLGLAYGGFTYTQDTHEASIGSLNLSIDEDRHVNIPVWAGVAMLVVGGFIFAGDVKRS